MKKLLLLIIIISACQQSQKPSAPVKQAPKEPERALSLSLQEGPVEPIGPIEIFSQEMPLPDDSKGTRILLDQVRLFETGEPYVRVELQDNFDWKAIDSLKKYADSVVYQDGHETVRTRYPWSRAREYLDLELLDGITIFNYEHKNFGDSKLKRIEFLEHMLGHEFVAVLGPREKLTGEKFYGINGINDFVNALSSRVINQSEIQNSVKKYIKANPKHEWHISGSIAYPYNLVHTVYSFVTNEGDEKSYLFETNSGLSNKVMSELTNDYIILDLTHVPVQINSRPLLLLWVGYPETDIEGHTPAIFNGVNYEITNSRILELNKFRNPKK